MRRTILVLMVAAVLAAVAAVPALGQDTGAPSAVIDDNGVAKASAGGTAAVAGCPAVPPEAKSGDVVAKAPCKPAPPPPPPPAPAPAAAPAPAPVPAPAPAPAKALPQSGGAGMASLLGLGAGVLLVSGGLLVRRFTR